MAVNLAHFVVSQVAVLTAQRNNLEKGLSIQKEKLNMKGGGGSGSGRIISEPERVNVISL